METGGGRGGEQGREEDKGGVEKGQGEGGKEGGRREKGRVK